MRSQFGTVLRAKRILAPWICCAALLLTGILGAQAALAEPSASDVVPQFDLCPGDGTDGYRVQALFGYTSSPAELETFRAEIDAANQSVTNTFGLSSLERVTPGSPNGLEQVVRWNCAGDTLPDIKTFAAGDPATRDYSSVTNAAVGAGFNAADRDYVIYVAGWNDFACGRGGLPETVTSPGARAIRSSLAIAASWTAESSSLASPITRWDTPWGQITSGMRAASHRRWRAPA